MGEAVIEVLSKGVEQTIALGEAIGRGLAGGEVVALIGELGTGKTHLIKGMALGLGAGAREAVTSPTFTLINEYEGRLRLVHVDAYRLENAGQLEALGFDEMVEEGAVVVVEWADRVEGLVMAYEPMVVRLEHRGETERLLRVTGVSTEVRERLEAVA